MCKEPKFYMCKHCGNMVSMFHDSGVPMICCGEEMTEIVANTTDAAQEKHVPVVTVEGDKVSVKVGSVPHPMTEEHRIVWIYLQTEKGEQLNCVDTQDVAETCFKLCDGDKPIAVFEYCNLHGLWKADYK
ncbi:MAG: desulfoferrodoxin [Clostridia bacterium]|nr:desulfoferrodoxin [Clostridia bacterium]